MHPALRKGPRFLQTPHFPFFTKNTPIFHFCTKKNTPPNFISCLQACALSTIEALECRQPTWDFFMYKSNLNTNNCSYLLQSIIWHSPDTNDLCSRHFDLRNRPRLTPSKKSHSTTEGNPVQIQLQHKQMFLFVTINHLTFTGHKRLMQQTFQSPKQAMSYTVR